MIDFYTWKTPNGQKIAIMLEELGIPYITHLIDISKKEQFRPEFLQINPNNKIPAIRDDDGPNHKPFSLFESGAILIYLAEKFGKFLATDPGERIKTIQWLMFQMANVGPMFGQANHFLNMAPEKVPYAVERYSTEVQRILKVMDVHFEKSQYFVKDYSIADMATFPWINIYEKLINNVSEYPYVKRWMDEVGERPGVEKGLKVVA